MVDVVRRAAVSSPSWVGVGTTETVASDVGGGGVSIVGLLALGSIVAISKYGSWRDNIARNIDERHPESLSRQSPTPSGIPGLHIQRRRLQAQKSE